MEFALANTGDRAGAEVAQVYMRQIQPSLPRPNKELKGFGKILLQPGEHAAVSIPLRQSAFAYYDPNQGGWLAEKGDYEILVGSSSRDIRLAGKFTLAENHLEKLMAAAQPTR